MILSMTSLRDGRVWSAIGVTLLLLTTAGCGQSSRSRQSTAENTKAGTAAMSISIRSDAFGSNQPIPARFTRDGENVSPAIRWEKLPPGTRELALICEDPDAPTPEPWVHWVIYKIPADATGLSEGVAKEAKLTSPAGAMQGVTSYPSLGYDGPQPPKGHGVHHYHFRVYALDKPLEVQPKLDNKGVIAAMSGHVLGTGELIGTYERPAK
jgi:Raf kinase inhibitor-like YbhB/YbcL family protein